MIRSFKWFLCAVLCIALLSACVGTVLADTKISKNVHLDGDFILSDQWFYVPDTVPEGYLADRSVNQSLGCKDIDMYRLETATSCEVTFISGEAALKDALVVDSEHDNKYIHVDNSRLTVPGQAVFNIKLESPSYIYDRDITLTVLDWNEHPLLESVNEHPVVTAKPGESVPFSKLADAVCKVNHDEIYRNLPNRPGNPDRYKPEDNTSIEWTDEKLFYTYLNEATVICACSREYGDYTITYRYRMGNIDITVPLTFSVQGYELVSEGTPERGATVRYSVVGSPEGRIFTWSVEGEGFSIDPSSGVMTIDKDAPAGTIYTVTAASEDGVVLQRRLYFAGTKTLFDDAVMQQSAWEGFLIPVPEENDKWYNYTPGAENEILCGGGWISEDNYLSWSVKWFLPDEQYAEDPDVAIREIQSRLDSFNNPMNEDVQTEIVQIDSHPAGLVTMKAHEQYNKNYIYHAGDLIYIRNNRYLQIQLYFRGHIDQESAMETVTLDDLKVIANQMGYDESQAPLSRLKAGMAVSSKDGSDRITAGKNLQMQADFEHPELINSKEKNNGITWSVVNAETGEEDPAATITDKGQLKIDKNLGAPVTLEVKATSVVFKTEASCTITAVPVVTGISVEPAELFFYVGSEPSQNARAILVPETMPLTGITWTPAGRDMVEITPVKDGTVSIRPLKAGKTTVNVAEPSGKKTKLNISIVAPVESLELSVKGNAKPGGTVTVNAALEPQNAGNKKVEWSLDVGEDVATITEKGQIKISKEAAPGTKITVTCKAPGAPEPVIATEEIVIP